MGDKDVKACLKEAREQIKNKDFKSALKECKKVLNKDKNNYMALVFCGLCLSELDQAVQSLQVRFSTYNDRNFNNFTLYRLIKGLPILALTSL